MPKAKINIRTNLGLEIRPEAQAVNGKTYNFEFGWIIDDIAHYHSESAFIPHDKNYPLDAPTWIASGDLEFIFVDLVTYCDNTEVLIAEVKAKASHLLNQDGSANLTKINTYRKENETLSLVRNPPPELFSLDSLQIWGTYDEVLADSTKKAKHDEIVCQQSTYTDEDTGEEITVKRDRMGGFA